MVTLESLLAPADADAATCAVSIARASKNITIEGNIDNVEYQVISKPQHAQNLIAAGATQDDEAASSVQSLRQSIIEQKLAQINLQKAPDQPSNALPSAAAGLNATQQSTLAIAETGSVKQQLVTELN